MSTLLLGDQRLTPLWVVPAATWLCTVIDVEVSFPRLLGYLRHMCSFGLGWVVGLISSSSVFSC